MILTKIMKYNKTNGTSFIINQVAFLCNFSERM